MRIVLIAGEPVFRMGFRSLVASSDDLALVGDAPDARSGFARIDSERPDLVVIDLALRGMSGISAIRELKVRAPDARMLLLAAWPRERDALEGFAAGAHGFALKSEPAETLLYAIRTVAGGRSYVTPELRGWGAELIDGRRAAHRRGERRRAGRAVSPGTRGAGPDHQGLAEPQHRPRAVHLHQDRRHPPHAHQPQASLHQRRRPHPLRRRQRPAADGAGSASTSRPRAPVAPGAKPVVLSL